MTNVTIPQAEDEEIKLSDFERELTKEELQTALKKLIELHNGLNSEVERLSEKVNQLDSEANWNRPYTI